jgi:GNAT superfamily N-acetyltransferase
MTGLVVREAQPGDEGSIFGLIQALAEYEKLSEQVTGSPEALGRDLFGARPAAEAVVAEVDGVAVGYALYFGTYSTFLTRPGVYLEDLFVLPEHRGQGIGRALLSLVASVTVRRGGGRLEWSVLDWNEPAIQFYLSLGAEPLEEWTMYRVTGDALTTLAARPS